MSEKSSSMGKDFILFASKASRLIESDKTDQALNLCEAGVRSFPFYAPGHYVLGLCYQAMDKKDEAKNEFERALVFDPAHSKAMRKLSEFYQGSGLLQIADEWLVKEALYNPLDQSLINILKEKNLYDQLTPGNNGANDVVEENALVLEEEAEPILPEDIEPVTDEIPQNEETATDVEAPAQVKDETPIKEENENDKILVEEKEEPGLIDNLDPLADNDILQKDQSNDLKEEPKPVDKDLNQFANMEDDFSTIMDGYFDTDEESAQESSDDEWIEVENLLIDEEETSTHAAVTDEAETGVDEMNEELTESETRDETELLLEQLSDLETEEKVVEEKAEVLPENEILSPQEMANEPEPVEEPEESIIPPIPDTVPEPVIETSKLSELNPEEEVTIQDLMENPNLVTPTFGEILVSQRKFSEARHIFMELLKREPDNLRFLKKVQFLDKFIATQKV